MSKNKYEEKFRFEIKDLPPVKNVNGGLHLGNSQLTASPLSRDHEIKNKYDEKQTNQTITRMITLFTLTVVGSIMMGVTAHFLFNGWLSVIASISGALAGLFLAAICWTSGKN